ncbi:MAG: hypothetical protein ACREJX_08760, partial [Polyangiaceae bacterium]
MLEHLVDERERASRVDSRKRGGRADAERELADAVGLEARFVEQGASDCAIVADTRRASPEADDGAASIRLDFQ